MARSFAALFCGLILAFPLSAAFAADVPYEIMVDGRPVDASHHSGLNRAGIVYVNVVRAVKTFDGLLTFDRGGLVRVSIGDRKLVFTIGSKSAALDGSPLQLSGAPFKVLGDVYVPLAPVATLAHAKLTVNRRLHRAALTLGAGEGFAVPAPTGTEQSDVQPSPAQALTFATSATPEGDGLHARVVIANTTSKAYTIDFPTANQVAFVILRDGTEVWSSARPAEAGAPSHVTIEPRGRDTISETIAAFAGLGAGRFQLRVRLMTAVPVDSAPVSLGVTTPAPTADELSPSPAARPRRRRAGRRRRLSQCGGRGRLTARDA